MIYLNATNEETLMSALIECGWAWDTEYETVTDEDGNITVTDKVLREKGVDCYTETHSLDIIGTIYKETGNTLTSEPDIDGNTFEYPEMLPIDGYHANLILHGETLPHQLSEFVIEAPSRPYRKFA